MLRIIVNLQHGFQSLLAYAQQVYNSSFDLDFLEKQ